MTLDPHTVDTLLRSTSAVLNEAEEAYNRGDIARADSLLDEASGLLAWNEERCVYCEKLLPFDQPHYTQLCGPCEGALEEARW